MQWFDIASLSDPSIRQDVQYQGLAESGNTIRALIESESQDLPLNNIILGGLSQGCAMALSVLLSLGYSLGGFFGMSGWLPFQRDIAQLVAEEVEHDDEDDPFNREESKACAVQHPMITAAKFQRDALSIDALDTNQEHTALLTPVFIGHGEEDPKIPSHLGESAAQTLRRIGLDVTWKLYAEQGHWYKVPEEIDDIIDFLEKKTNAIVIKS
jgi:predicted esterase